MTRIANLSRKDAVKNSGVFSEKLKKAGYDTVVYIEKGKFMNAEDYSPREVWFADYTEPYDNPYYMLQYSKEGKVDGISGTVDLDIMYIE
jgi:GH25 family lysozyme M1 (1,4-beta-N-acetylmuramidase)